MSFAARADWLAVIEADRILNKIEHQNDLAYARGFDKKTIGGAKQERKANVNRYEKLMVINQHSGDGWATIKNMGGSSGGLKLVK